MIRLIMLFLIVSACSPLKEYAETKAVFEKEVSALEKLDLESTASKTNFYLLEVQVLDFGRTLKTTCHLINL